MYSGNDLVSKGSFIYDDITIELTTANIPYDSKDTTNNYYIKFDLIDSDGSYEGVWGLVSEADYNKYNSNIKEYITVVLANNTLAGLSWGCVFPLKLVGDRRPSFDIRLVDENNIMYKVRNND
jgi:hypothetical protein